MRKLISTAILFASSLVFALPAALAQQIDAAFGGSTTEAPSASDGLNSSKYSPQSLRGGTYLGFSGDFLLKHQLGVGGEINFRGSRALYYSNNQEYKPVYWDFNGVWVPSLGKYAAADLQAGIGAQSVRYYLVNGYNCGQFSGCTNYTSDNQFMGHFGTGLRVYVHGNVFLRPEAHLYLVNNNRYFSSFHTERYGISIGYSFGRQDHNKYGY